MKLCFVAHLNDLSGANRSLIDLINVLRSKHDICVIVPRKGELYDYLCNNGYRCVLIPSGMWMYSPKENKCKIILKYIANIIGEIIAFFFFLRNRFDIVHFNSSTYGCGAASLMLLNRDYTWHIRELAEDTFGLRFFNKKHSCKLIANSRCCIAISKFIKNKISKDLPGINIPVVYNGVKIKQLKPVSDVKINSLLLVGAINSDKGQLVALKAVKELRDKYRVYLNIHFLGKITNRYYYKELEDYISNTHLEKAVHFDGYKQDISEYRTNDRLVLMCSTQEAFGRVTIEAFANQQIIVGNNTGATPEIIRDGKYGFLYENNYESLARVIYRIVNNPNLGSMINESYNYVRKEFSIERTAHEIEKLFLKHVQ